MFLDVGKVVLEVVLEVLEVVAGFEATDHHRSRTRVLGRRHEATQ